MPNYLFHYDLNTQLNTQLNNHLNTILNTNVECKEIVFNNRKYVHITFQSKCKSDIDELNNYYIDILRKNNIHVKHHKIIYLGIRNYKFTHFIYQLLLTSKLKVNYINQIINNPNIMSIKVVFPEPDSPIIPALSPFLILNDISLIISFELL